MSNFSWPPNSNIMKELERTKRARFSSNRPSTFTSYQSRAERRDDIPSPHLSSSSNQSRSRNPSSLSSFNNATRKRSESCSNLSMQSAGFSPRSQVSDRRYSTEMSLPSSRGPRSSLSPRSERLTAEEVESQRVKHLKDMYNKAKCGLQDEYSAEARFAEEAVARSTRAYEEARRSADALKQRHAEVEQRAKMAVEDRKDRWREMNDFLKEGKEFFMHGVTSLRDMSNHLDDAETRYMEISKSNSDVWEEQNRLAHREIDSISAMNAQFASRRDAISDRNRAVDRNFLCAMAPGGVLSDDGDAVMSQVDR